MTSRRIATATLALVLIGATACSPIVRRHGYVPEKESLDTIVVEKDNKATVLARFGNPSTRAIFEDDTWYYITNVRQQLGYLEPEAAAREIYAVRFNNDGMVTAVDNLSLDDARNVNYVSRETPTRGRELTLLEQLLGNVGRLPTDTIAGQDNLPGGAGGPRRE